VSETTEGSPHLKFVLLVRNYPAGARAMLGAGSQHMAFQDSVVGEFGGDVTQHLTVAGQYDAVVVCEFPSFEAAVAFCLAATADGQYVEALPALDASALQEASQLAENVVRKQLDAARTTPPSQG
jgi:uncharacterized protein with GYD domain